MKRINKALGYVATLDLLSCIKVMIEDFRTPTMLHKLAITFSEKLYSYDYELDVDLVELATVSLFSLIKDGEYEYNHQSVTISENALYYLIEQIDNYSSEDSIVFKCFAEDRDMISLTNQLLEFIKDKMASDME